LNNKQNTGDFVQLKFSNKFLKHKKHLLKLDLIELDMNQYVECSCNTCHMYLGRISLIFVLRNLG